MTQFEFANKITSSIHSVLSNSYIKDARTLYTSAVLLHLLREKGIEAKLWQGTTQWFSKKYVELYNQGYDFSLKAFDELDESKLKKKADSLKRKGVLSVSCIANQDPTKETLDGHVAIMAILDGNHYLIDPSSYQFKRTQAKDHAIIDSPNVAFFELFSFEYNNPEDFSFFMDNYGASYKFEELNSLLMLQHHNDVIQTDFNPFKYNDLYQEIISNIE